MSPVRKSLTMLPHSLPHPELLGLEVEPFNGLSRENDSLRGDEALKFLKAYNFICQKIFKTVS